MTSSSQNYPPVKLPHPFLTTYRVHTVSETTTARHILTLEDQPTDGRHLPLALHSESLSWLDLTFPPKDDCPPDSDNTPWARARRSPSTAFDWTEATLPSLAQVWNVVHAIFLAHPTYEYFRITLLGEENETIRAELLATGLGIEHPWLGATKSLTPVASELLILRSSFWQGAASPTGPRPIWTVGDGTDGPLREPLAQYPLMPENYQITMKFPEECVYTRHPTRRPKPHLGSIVYSRYIPEINEHFSLEVVNWQDDEHLKLFNRWQNDPRVAKGWNETGTLEQHRQYLRRLHFDPHVLCLFGCFDKTRFAYFELYWAKVSRHQITDCLCIMILTLLSRRTIMAPTTMLEITTGDATRSLEMRHSAAHSA